MGSYRRNGATHKRYCLEAGQKGEKNNLFDPALSAMKRSGGVARRITKEGRGRFIMIQTVYFQDNFFSSGETEIRDGTNQCIGSLDLKSAFSSSVAVMDEGGHEVMHGFFRFLSNSWYVEDGNRAQLGSLKPAWFSFSKKYHYQTNSRGNYEITSPAFLKDKKVYKFSG